MSRRRPAVALALSLLAAATPAGARSHVVTGAAHRHDRVFAAAARAGVDARLLATTSDLDGYSVAIPGGDFDHDGTTDVLDFRYTGVATATGREVHAHVDARRGQDGALLWSYAAPTDLVFGYGVVGKVGPTGALGILYVAYRGTLPDAAVATGGTAMLDVVALDGHGKTIWTTSFAGAVAATPAGANGETSYVAGFLDGIRGPATDVLVGTESWSEDSFGDQIDTALPRLVDGATGALVGAGAPATSKESLVYLQPLPDLSGDGLDDYAVMSRVTVDVSLTARRTSDGTAIWASVVDTFEFQVHPVGDVTGDRVADLVMDEYQYLDNPHLSQGRVQLYDGAKGSQVWSKPGYHVIPLGNVDGRGGIEVAVVESKAVGEGSIRVDAYGAAGRSLWQVTRRMDMSRYRGAYNTTEDGPAGDLTGDGVAELRYAVIVRPDHAPERREEGWIDGRTGRVRRDPLREVLPLGAAVDGRGADRATAQWRNGLLTATTRAGGTTTALWSTTVAVAGPEVMTFTLTAGRFTRDGCADVFVDLRGTADSAVLFDGASGAPLWVIDRTGGVEAKVTHPRPTARTDHNSC